MYSGAVRTNVSNIRPDQEDFVNIMRVAYLELNDNVA